MSEGGIEAEAIENAVCPACGAALGAEHKPLEQIDCPTCAAKVMVPGKLGQYRLVRLIGAGGMGAVYEGFDEGLQRKVAVKVILREKAAEDPSFIESFRHEAQAAAKLNSTNIVGVYAFGEAHGQPYLVMELVQPDSLDRMMARGAVPPQTALDVTRQIAQGLRAAAEQGLVHGDVKPENILINDAHEAKLADFGIAALAGAKAAANNEVWGTPYYIAPETLRRQKVDLRADIYSLGATIYHAIAGVPPFEGADAVEVMKGRLLGPARPLTEVAPACPEAVAKIVMRMLEAEPIRRYPNYESLLADIEKVVPSGRGHAGNKKILIKGKGQTQGLKSMTGPSQPMTSVETPNAPLFEKPKEGLSTGAIIGIAVGALLALVLVVGGAIAFILSTAKRDVADVAEQLQAAQGEMGAAIDAAAQTQQLAAERQALGEIVKAAEQRAQVARSAATQGASIVKTLAQQARRATLPEDQAWLEANEAEAPSELLRRLQALFQDAAALAAVATQADALRGKVDGLAAQSEGAELPALQAATAEAKAALEAYDASGEVKAAAKRLAALTSARNNWKKAVDRGRAEMEAAVAKRLEEEKQAKVAAAAAAEAERKQQAIAEEVTAVAQAEAAVGGELDRFLPEAALEAFKGRTARLRSAEAKTAAEAAMAKLACFARLKAWLIREASEGKLAGFGVLGADAQSVTLKDGKAVAWRDFVGDKQVIAFRILSGLIASDSGSRTLKASERADLAVGAYAFIGRFFGEEQINKSKAVRETMEKFKTLAEALPAARVELERFTASGSEGE